MDLNASSMFGLVLISCNTGLNIFKILTLQRCIELLQEFNSRYFSILPGDVRKISCDLATSLRFCSSLIDLEYSLKCMVAKSSTSSSVKIFK